MLEDLSHNVSSNEFRGFYTRRLDTPLSRDYKNRLTIPVRFREVICERNKISLDELVEQNKLLYHKNQVYYKGLVIYSLDMPVYSKENPIRLDDNISVPEGINRLVYFGKIQNNPEIRAYAAFDWFKIDPKDRELLLKREMDGKDRIIIPKILKQFDSEERKFKIEGKIDYFTIIPI